MSGKNKFDEVCKDLLDKTGGQIKGIYDYVLIDEAQDFSESFYWLCRKLTKKDNLVWAYDQLQNILNIKIQDTKTLFKNEYGDEGIDLEYLREEYPELKNDIVLSVCYRNPREILMLAHAIGFGIYNERILQILENAEHWADNGYEILQGACKEGERTIITRNPQNASMTISKKYTIGEIIETYKAVDFDDEIKWIITTVEKDLEDGLLPQDIMIVCLDQKYIGSYKNKIVEKFKEKNIYINNTVNSNNIEFFVDGAITFTSVYKAKGNESASVYVIGCDSLWNSREDITARNKLFTAFTRSKAWLKVSGLGEKFEFLEKEINRAIEMYPNLDFIYPNPELVNKHNRDLAKNNMATNKLLEYCMKHNIKIDEVAKMLANRVNETEIKK